MNRLIKMTLVFFGVGIIMGMPGYSAASECYTQTIPFDPDQGYSWNIVWEHDLTDMPSDCQVESSEIEVRAQVWSWGWSPYLQDILVSNSTTFNYSEGYVCSLTPSTHQNPSNFYTIGCDLDSNQTSWILDDGFVNFMMVTFGGTYYMDYARLTVCCSDVGPPVIDAISYDGCIGEGGNAQIEVTAFDPAGGTLSYTWEALDGGSISGSGSSVAFDPPDSGPHPCPYRIKVTVTSDAGDQLSSEETVGITVKLAGDVDGDGVVNIVDKALVRNAFGLSGAPGWIAEDVNGDGAVNIVDKVIVKNQFGSSGCGCP